MSILKDIESGKNLDDVCKQHGLSSETYYKWRNLYGSPALFEEREERLLKELKVENEKLRRMYIDLSLEHEELKSTLNDASK